MKEKIKAIDMEEVNNLKDQLGQVSDDIQNAVSAAEEASNMAAKLGGEIDRVVSGQLDSYLIGSLNSFTDDEGQAGSIPHLLNFLDDENQWKTEAKIKEKIKALILKGKTEEEIKKIIGETKEEKLERYKKEYDFAIKNNQTEVAKKIEEEIKELEKVKGKKEEGPLEEAVEEAAKKYAVELNKEISQKLRKDMDKIKEDFEIDTSITPMYDLYMKIVKEELER